MCAWTEHLSTNHVLSRATVRATAPPSQRVHEDGANNAECVGGQRHRPISLAAMGFAEPCLQECIRRSSGHAMRVINRRVSVVHRRPDALSATTSTPAKELFDHGNGRRKPTPLPTFEIETVRSVMETLLESKLWKSHDMGALSAVLGGLILRLARHIDPRGSTLVRHLPLGV